MKPIERKMRLAARSIALPAIALAMASPAPASAAAEHAGPAHPAAATAATPGKQAWMHTSIRASQLIGKDVRSRENVDVGNITDLVINMDTGNVRYAVLKLRGEIGPGETRLYAIPVKSLTRVSRNGDLVLAMDTGQWRERSAFPAGKWPDLRNSGYWSEIDRLSGIPAVQPADGYFAHRASELIGRDVQNYEGHKLGVLRDLVIDMNRQAVRYVALDFEPGAAATGKLYSFPVGAFAFPEDQSGTLKTGRLVLDVEPAELSTMRSFDEAHWPGVTGPRHMAANEISMK
jgi:sporulation protein YlmC with PRC-barrel domain